MPFLPLLLPETEFNKMLFKLQACLGEVLQNTCGVSLCHEKRLLEANRKLLTILYFHCAIKSSIYCHQINTLRNNFYRKFILKLPTVIWQSNGLYLRQNQGHTTNRDDFVAS